jgi:hypothetical protein
MGLLRSLLGSHDDASEDDRVSTDELNSVHSLMNPIAGMTLEEFVVAGSGFRPRHYFKFRNQSGEFEEFIVCYDCFDDTLIYSRSASRKAGEEDFAVLNEQVWSMSISYLDALGRKLAVDASRVPEHFAADERIGWPGR